MFGLVLDRPSAWSRGCVLYLFDPTSLLFSLQSSSVSSSSYCLPILISTFQTLSPLPFIMATNRTHPNGLRADESVTESLRGSKEAIITPGEFDLERNITPSSSREDASRWKGRTDPFANPDGGDVEFRTMRWWLVHTIPPLTRKNVY